MNGNLQCPQMPVRRKGGMGKNWMWMELLVAWPVLQESILNQLDLSDLPAEPEFTDFITILHYFLNQFCIHACLCAC